MINKEQIEKEAQYYLNNQNETMKSTADHFGISIRSLQLHFKKLESLSNDTFILIQKKKEKAQIAGRINGGQIGKRTISISKNKLKEIAIKMINEQLTYEEAANMFKIPSSTLWELLHGNTMKEIDENNYLRTQLELLTISNKRNKSMESMLEEQFNDKKDENITKYDK